MANNTSLAVIPFNAYLFTTWYTCESFGSSVSSLGIIRKWISSGVLRKHDFLLLHPLPLLLFQLGAVVITAAIFRCLLRPLKQPRFVPEMLTGILLGPQLFKLGNENLLGKLIMVRQSRIADVLELLSFTFFGFLVGVRTDIGVIKKTGKVAWIIGITTFALPVVMALPAAYFLSGKNEGIYLSLNSISVLGATTSFQVTSVLLEDLKLLNSEIGRLALSSSLICNLFGIVFKSVNALVAQTNYLGSKLDTTFKIEASRLGVIIITIFALRPIVFWMMKKIPEGRTIKESHLVVMVIMLYGMAFTTELLGLQAYFGGMILGFAVPAGPPLASGLADKLNLIIFALLLPAYILDTGRDVNVELLFDRVNMELQQATYYGAAELIVILAYVGKLVAAAVPSLFFMMPYSDALSLGLILSSQGFFDIMLFKRALRFMLISKEYYTILTVTAVVYAAAVTPVISYLYDPSKRYVNYRRRTIQHSRHGTELRILVCLHEEESIFSTINLLKASYSTRESPLGVFVLDLMDLVGREHPLFINHQFHKRRSSNRSRSDRIIRAFHHYELQREGTVRNQYFTSFTPYASMHDDVCTVALQKSTSLLVIPFQKSESHAVRAVKKSVLDKAPCSVGILVEKRIFTNFMSEWLNEAKFHICVIFTGGPDSREALAYGIQMVANPSSKLTVMRLIAEDEFITDLVEAKRDLKSINEVRSFCGVNDRIVYSEVSVQDGAETSRVLLSLDERYDFILVGRRVNTESPLVSGLTEWDNYIEELGIIGDVLASSDMKSNASVLVLQQQSTVEDLIPRLR